jgi:plastocyanin
MKTLKIIASAAALTVLAGGLAWAAGATVSQKDKLFSAPEVTITAGSAVTFTNDDTVSHNIMVRGDSMKVNVGVQKPGESTDVPFAESGEFQVICGIHPKMKMTVKVEP